MKSKFFQFLGLLLLAFLALITFTWHRIVEIVGSMVPGWSPPIAFLSLLLCTLAALVLALGKYPPSRWRIASRLKLLCQITPGALVPLLLLFVCSGPAVQAQVSFQPTIWRNFTNAFTNGVIGNFNNTNNLLQLTNGTTTVTSAPVAMVRGRGIGLGFVISPTNALLTNVVATYQFSPDGTNWMDEPVITVRTATAAIAAGKYRFKTNITEDVIGNNRFVRLNQVFITNGVNTVGSTFCTNNGPMFFWEVFP